MKNLSRLFLLLLPFLPYSSFAGSPSPAATNSESNFISDLAAELEFVQGRVLQLAEAIPQEKYSWRPGEGVRSVSEALVHIGVGNYFALSFLGGSKPEGLDGMEKKLTQKAEIADFIKQSFADATKYISTLKMEDMEKPVDFFGNKMDGRRMLFLLLYHSHEHLGQLIAYARMNQIVPPWSKGN